MAGALVSKDFRSTHNVYDEHGNLIETIDALGNSERRIVDQFGRVTSISSPALNTLS
jgi:YD repeat-containing protein